jgi:hypothetical protein
VKNSKACLLCIALIALCFLESSCGLPDQESVLYRVMQRLKFRVTKIKAAQPARLDRLDVLFLWRLRRELDEQEIEGIHRFVEDGGTLIVAGDHESLNSLLHHYGLEMRKASNSLETSRRIPTDPIFPNRPVDEVYSTTDYAIQQTERDVAPLYGQDTDYSILTFREGGGRAVFITCPDIFARYGLQDDRNAMFLYNLMSTLPHRARVGLAQFGYYAAGSASAANPLMYLLFNTAGGLGVVYSGVIVFLFLILRGRRFGKPLAVEETHRRVSSEYVHAMTALYQKGDTHRAILQQIRDTFRSNLAARWHINPNLESTSFVEEIARRKPIDTDELLRLLTELEPRGTISEARLLSLAKQVEAYCDRANIGHSRPTHR